MNAVVNIFILLVLASVAHLATAGDTVSATTALASKASTVTLCAEDDNVNIPISGDVTSFFVEATNPIYPIGVDNCKPDFSGCPPGTNQNCTETFSKIYDDGTHVVQTVRLSCWWLPDGMTVTVNSGEPHTQVHFVAIYRKIADQSSWPQFLVLYADGNMRLKPHPPAGVEDVCFGSSVIIGPAARAARPFVQISSVN